MSTKDVDPMEVWASELSKIILRTMPMELTANFKKAALAAGIIEPDPEPGTRPKQKAPIPGDPSDDPSYEHVINPRAHALRMANESEAAEAKPEVVAAEYEPAPAPAPAPKKGKIPPQV